MRSLTPIFAVLRAAALVVLVVAVAACSRNGAGGTGVGNLGPAAAPRAASRNSSCRSATACSSRPIRRTSPPTAMATLDKQAAWLNQYSQVPHHDRRPCRRARHPRVQHRAGRPPRLGGGELPRQPRASNRRRITSKSFGKERPVAICNDISCWSQNRRAVTVVQ